MSGSSSNPIEPLPVRPIKPVEPLKPFRPIKPVGPIKPVAQVQGVIRGTYLFDFESGGETAIMQEADVWWEQHTETLRSMVPLNGASLYALGVVDFDSVSMSNLPTLPYSTEPIQANVVGTNMLPDGSVFATRTRHGKFVKVGVIKYDYNLQIRWVTYTRPINFLDVKVTMGSAPEWLVTQYVVQCTYTTPDGVKNCGTGTFGHEGGIVSGQISDESGSFPSSVVVNVSIDFVPDTTIHATQKIFTVPVTDTGVNFIFEPDQVIQKTEILLDLQPQPKSADYILLQWQHHDTNGNVVTSGQKYISGDELRKQPVTQYEIAFVRDPISAKDIKIQIDGRFQDKVLPQFTQIYEVSDQAIIIRAESQSDGGYKLVSS